MARSLRGSRITVLITALIAGGVLAGCSAAPGRPVASGPGTPGPGTPGQVASGRPSPTTGTVTGKFIRVGGPIAVGAPQPKVVRLSGVISFTRPGHNVSTVKVDKSGTFSVRLAAGTYAVSGRSPSLTVASGGGRGREMRCSIPLSVQVQPGRTSKIAVTCPVP